MFAKQKLSITPANFVTLDKYLEKISNTGCTLGPVFSWVDFLLSGRDGMNENVRATKTRKRIPKMKKSNEKT